MNLEHYQFLLIQTVILIVILVVLKVSLGSMVDRFARRFERVEHRTGLIRKYINFSLIFLAVFGLILIWGVDVKNLGVVMSSIFAVIGIALFAQWSILCNITSGVIMFFTFPYKIGDFIKIHDKDYDYEGIIEDIKTFHVVIRTSANQIVTYPNSLMLQKGVSVIKPDEFEENAIIIDPDHDLDENVKEQPID